MSGERGFTLVEALVALAILAVAAAGLVRAAEGHVDSIRSLEQRAAAQWVAENRLAELALPGGAAGAGQSDRVEMLGTRWQVATQDAPSDDPDLRRVTVEVRAPGDRAPIVTLDGFVDAGTTTATPPAGATAAPN